MESLGTHVLWGLSPSINAFNQMDLDLTNDENEINLLFTDNGGDAKNILKTCADLLKDYKLEQPREKPINIYLHESTKENLARNILFLTLICETGLSHRERMELYLDLYGNTLIRDKT